MEFGSLEDLNYDDYEGSGKIILLLLVGRE